MDAKLKNEIAQLGRETHLGDAAWHLKAFGRVALRAFCADLAFIRDLGMSAAEHALTRQSLSAASAALTASDGAERHVAFVRHFADLGQFLDGWREYAGTNYHVAHWNLKRVQDCQYRFSRLLTRNKQILESFPLEVAATGWRSMLTLAENAPSTFYQLRQALAELCRLSRVEELQVLRPTRAIARIVSASVPLFRLLKREIDALYELSPGAFEDFVAERLEQMGMDVRQVGSTYQSDGGVDLIASPRQSPFPFLLAVQMKHHRLASAKTGPGAVKDLQAVVAALPFHAGMIVTNTTFTPDAHWWASKQPGKVQLHDISSIRSWIDGRYELLQDRNVPQILQLTPRLQVPVW